ncbi:hypothetical protein PHMEG_00033592 [Phytophthora megakarya]|uniref:Uncharacterized protein n=1 Tax=Phytophthora megakarya TaxID=4795 RepID=A0A225UTH4_9STRA|nr:hypothetical protein PHMEG_00033592 [Phytophthora megakarya]
MMGQEKEVLGVTDGTYKLDFYQLDFGFVRKQEYDDVIKPQLDLLERSRSEDQFFALSKTIMENWQARDEGGYADWLEEQYLSDPWDLWFITASNKAGIVANQNPIEAHHSSIKKVAAGHLRAAILHVLAATLPKILIHCGRDGSMIPIRTFAPGLITEDIYVAAKALCKSENHYPRHKGKIKHAIAQIQRYYFTANYYVVNDDSLYGLKVAKARTTKYAKHPHEIFHFEDKVGDIQLSYQSLHAVDAEHHRALFHDWASPIWTDLEI